MKKIVISLLLLAVCDIPLLRASDTNAAMPKKQLNQSLLDRAAPQISQSLLKRAKETLANPEVDEAEKVKVSNALKNYNANPTTKIQTIRDAVRRAHPRAREAKREYDKARREKPEVRDAQREYHRAWRAKPKVREAQSKYNRAWYARRKEKLAKKLSLQQQQTLRDIQRNRSSAAAAPGTVEAPLAQWLDNISNEELESLLQGAQQQQTIAHQANNQNDQNDPFLGFDFDAALHNLEEAPDLGAFDEFDDDSAVQSSSEGNFFGEEDLRSRLLVPQPKATARVQALGKSSDARAQQLAQRRLSSSDDESEYEEPELSDNE